MLTLEGAFRSGRFTVFRDVSGTGPDRRLGPRFYCLPDTPRLAVAADGEPELDLVWFRGPAGTRRAGAALTVTVELGSTADERDALAAEIRTRFPAEDLTGLEVTGVPFIDGSVQLSLATAADAPPLPPVPARLQGGQRATVVAELAADDAAILVGLLDQGGDVLQARYDLTYAYRLDGVRMRVWCDGGRARALAEGLGPADPGRLRGALRAEQAAGVEVLAERPLAEDERARLQALGDQLLDAALSGLLAGTASETTLQHTFDETVLLPQHAIASAPLRPGRTTAELAAAGRFRTVELTGGFFAVLDVVALCTVDFERDPVDAVHLYLAYDGSGPTGRVHRESDFVFRAGTGPQHFRTDLAAPDVRAVSWRAEVHYRGDPEPVVLEQPPIETTLIVLDLDGAGVLQVSAGLRDPSWSDVSAVTVELEHPSTGHAARLVLDRGLPEARWTEVVRSVPGPVRYRATWHRADGTDLTGEWAESVQRRLLLDLPEELRRRAGVQLVAVGDFTGLAQVLVELRSADGAPVTTYDFSAAGQEALWPGDGLSAADLRYQCRLTVVRTDGGREELAWADHDSPVLVIGDLLRYDVLVEPRLLDLGGSWRLALLELAAGTGEPGSPDPGSADATLILRDRSVPQHWSFRQPAPGRSDYRYRLSLLPVSGPRQTGPWTAARTGVLVLRPPTTDPDGADRPAPTPPDA